MNKKYLALCGGVGGAKLAYGLSKTLKAENLFILVNTGDDFVLNDLHICPDLDTVIYTLAGINDRERGWGIEEETWKYLETLKKFSDDSWFQLGDKDLITHIQRSYLLKNGLTLSLTIKELCKRYKVSQSIFPMSETPVCTILDTHQGELSFQEYFVKNQCKPIIKSISFKNSENSFVPKSLKNLMDNNFFDEVIICPSNPYLSIDPILSINDIKQYLINRDFPVIAVSPIINSAAIKGPTVKIMKELGIDPTSSSIAQHYEEVIDYITVDKTDKVSHSSSQAIKYHFTDILMKTDSDKKMLAKFCINLLN